MCQEVDPRGGGFDKRSRAGGFDKRSRAVSLFFPDGTVVMDYSTLVTAHTIEKKNAVCSLQWQFPVVLTSLQWC
jgi:hypothetical protein